MATVKPGERTTLEQWEAKWGPAATWATGPPAPAQQWEGGYWPQHSDTASSSAGSHIHPQGK